MKLYLIRHSKTYGNTLGRYIGVTDESLCQAGIDLIKNKTYPAVDFVYVSPLKRCLETADLIYPDVPKQVITDLAECDFGDFENKNYQELNGNPDYQKWVDSNGTLPFPNGESQQEFRVRCIRGFIQVINMLAADEYANAAVVVHGGTIMSILDQFSMPHEDFYHWQVKNAEGFEIEIDLEQWKSGKKEAVVCGPIGR